MNLNFSSMLFWQHAAPAQQSILPIARPSRDWNILLGVAAAILLIILGLTAGLYWWNSETPETAPSQSRTQLLSPQKLTSLLTTYDALATEHAALLEQSPVFADPAIAK